MDSSNFEGNISTILVWIYCILAPYISQYISQDVFIALVGILLAIWSSSNPNTFAFLHNDGIEEEVIIEDESDLINEEYDGVFDDEEENSL